MKKLILLVAILFFSTNLGTSYAQKYSRAISGDPVFLAFHSLYGTYEHQVSPVNSFTVIGIFFNPTGWSGFGLGGSYRWYFDIDDGKSPIQGLSAGPMAIIGFWSWSGSGIVDYGSETSIALGGELAYKWVFNGKFMVEPIIRVAFPIGKISGLTYPGNGIGVNLGYAW